MSRKYLHDEVKIRLKSVDGILMENKRMRRRNGRGRICPKMWAGKEGILYLSLVNSQKTKSKDMKWGGETIDTLVVEYRITTFLQKQLGRSFSRIQQTRTIVCTLLKLLVVISDRILLFKAPTTGAAQLPPPELTVSGAKEFFQYFGLSILEKRSPCGVKQSGLSLPWEICYLQR